MLILHVLMFERKETARGIGGQLVSCRGHHLGETCTLCCCSEVYVSRLAVGDSDHKLTIDTSAE